MARNSESRRADGKPETAKDRKFFDLRESGYKGPVDQDGNKSTTLTSGSGTTGK